MNRNDKFKNIAEMKFRVSADLIKFFHQRYIENCERLDDLDNLSASEFSFICGQMSIAECLLIETGVLSNDEVYQLPGREKNEND